MKLDVHQHVWTPNLLDALAEREELPFVRYEQGLTVLFLAGERPFVIDTRSERSADRAALVSSDGLDRAFVCLSSPLGIECLPRDAAQPLLEAYCEGALALGSPFGVWGAIALDRAAPADVERALARGCVGISLPAGALGSIDGLARLAPVLATLEHAGAPLFVHPGPGSIVPGRGRSGIDHGLAEPSLNDPLWWSALTRYVADMQAAWLAFSTTGRPQHPRLRVVFSMLAGLAPLHAERLRARGGPATPPHSDPLTFYETSSYGASAVRHLAEAVGHEQLLYGSDRPVVDPARHGVLDGADWGLLAENASRAFGGRPRAGVTERDVSRAHTRARVSSPQAPTPQAPTPQAPTPQATTPQATTPQASAAPARARVRRRTAAVLANAARELSR